MNRLTYDDFLRVEIRVGKVVRVEDHPRARKPAYKVWVDFGELGVKSSSAQLTRRYTKADLLGRQVVAVVNLEPKRVAGFVSEVLILGAMVTDEDVVLLRPDADVAPGTRVL